MKTPTFNVLIVDDEPNIRSGLARGLSGEADYVCAAADAHEALQVFNTQEYQLVITDVRLNCDMSGIDLAKKMLLARPQTGVIVITAHGTVETAVDAMRAGAFDFISKPLDLNLVRQQVRKARENYTSRLGNGHGRTNGDLNGHHNGNHPGHHNGNGTSDIPSIVGNCPAMQDVFHQIRQVADTEATVMIHGESGTGKELIARALHDLSGRRHQPFLAVSLGAMPETLLESELFGHEKGSFSGASRKKPGCFEQANGGTLFLDEVTEMSPKSQVDLLRVLESHTFTRIGGEDLLHTDVRVLSATNKSVPELIDNGSFREDLYYRLNVVPIEVPALRQRREDIPLLVEHFLQHFCKHHNRSPKTVSAEAMASLMSADWPGNVRQLRNLMERLVVTMKGDVLEISDLLLELESKTATQPAAARTLGEAVEECERNTISAALEACKFHREKTAQHLGISIRTLHYKMGRYDLR